MGLAVVNNVDKETKQEYIEALESRGAKIILWDQRHQQNMIEKLVA